MFLKERHTIPLNTSLTKWKWKCELTSLQGHLILNLVMKSDAGSRVWLEPDVSGVGKGGGGKIKRAVHGKKSLKVMKMGVSWRQPRRGAWDQVGVGGMGYTKSSLKWGPVTSPLS